MAAATYLDFDVAVTGRGDTIEVRVLESPAGETGSLTAPWPAVADRWVAGRHHRETRRLAPAEPSAAAASPAPALIDADAATQEPDDRDVGQALFRSLMPDAALVRFRESASRAARAGSGLRLMLRFSGGADVLPWELLHDPETHTFLALDPATPVVRCTETPVREPTAGVDERVRVLVVVSSPVGTPPLDAASERRSIAARLAPLVPSGAVTVDVLEDASLDGIRRALDAAETHVLHYIGHGGIGPDGHTVLALTGPGGDVALRSVDDLAEVLGAAPTLRLVVLNSCHGSPADPTDPFAGAGPTLVRAGVPSVIAMRTAVTDDAAISFAGALYESLAAAEPIERAVARARAALAAHGSGVEGEWPIVALHLSSSLAPGLRPGPLPRLDEDVEFTVARPPELRAERWETMLVLAHHGADFVAADGSTVDQPAQVRQRISGFFGSEPVTATSRPSSLALPRGAELVVVPDLPRHVDCEPPSSPLAWTGEVAEVRFLLRAPSASVGSTVQGWLRVFCGPVVIAEAPLELPVVGGAGAPAAAPAPVRTSAMARYRRIFPCFSPEDSAVVEGVVAVAEALGDDYLDRVLESRQGDAPSAWLLPLIEDADVFQLFWSTHSMVSPACRDQWEHAVASGREGFVLPLYWEQPFPRSDGLPPADLASLRFVRLPVTAPLPPPVATAPVTSPSPPPPPPPPPAPAPAPAEEIPDATSAPPTTRGLEARRSAKAARAAPLAAASLTSALLAVGFIAVGWSPGVVPGTHGSALDVVGLALLALAVVLGALAVARFVRRRR